MLRWLEVASRVPSEPEMSMRERIRAGRGPPCSPGGAGSHDREGAFRQIKFQVSSASEVPSDHTFLKLVKALGLPLRQGAQCSVDLTSLSKDQRATDFLSPADHEIRGETNGARWLANAASGPTPVRRAEPAPKSREGVFRRIKFQGRDV